MNATKLQILRSALFVTVIAAGCATAPSPLDAPPAPVVERPDPHSFARPQQVAVSHLSLDLDVDFAEKRMHGTATLTIDNRSGADHLHVDTRDLDVAKVTLDDGAETEFSLGLPEEYLGQPLRIALRPGTKKVTVHYSTRPEAAAVQWLTPAQTSGGRLPFLFTQSQAILARTWVPIQDTPSVRFTYDATIRVPRELMAVMSAENPTTKNDSGVYTFRMPQPIPSYLLALAVGDLAFRPLGERSGVYAEPAVVGKAAREFEDTPAMIAAAEKLYGPYRWGRYDILVLPPSFPFGGMENPRLTFATPTILAGDKSLVALVAHELAHSWSGNLVTNATWDDFWLNEGFTVYFEQRIMEAVYGRPYSEMLAALALQDLRSELADLDAADTHLKLDLEGRDPDAGMTAVAYDKGYFFLRRMEELVGRERWDTFLRDYFERFAFRPMTTEGFVSHLKKELVRGNQQLATEIDEWIYGPGLPVEPVVDANRFVAVDRAIEAFLSGADPSSLEVRNWTTHEWLRFVKGLPSTLPVARMRALDQSFRFTNSGNSEVLSAWLQLAIRTNYREAYPALEKFLTEVGRRKFLKPIYTELAKTPEGMEFARRVYEKARPSYHSVSTQTIDEILKWNSR